MNIATMKPTTTAAFTIPDTTAASLSAQLKLAYPDLTTTSPKWTVTHSMYRPASSTPSQPSSGSLQLLQLSSYPKQTFLCTTTAVPDQDKSAVVAIQTDPGEADFRRLLRDKFGPLWQHVRGAEMRVTGTEMEVGMFRVIAADISRDRGVAGSGVESRGVMLSVTLLGEGVEEQTADEQEQGRELVEDFCNNLDLPAEIDKVWGSRAVWKDEVNFLSSFLRQQLPSSAGGRSRGGEH